MVKAEIKCPSCGNRGILDTSVIPCSMKCRHCGNSWQITWNEEKPGTILVTDLSTGRQFEGWIPIGQ